MTILELTHIICNSNCEVTISPSEMYNTVYVTVKNKDKSVRYGFTMDSAFVNPEEIFDHIIKMSIYQVQDNK